MSPLSSDPQRRAAQLANLRQGETRPDPTNARKHGGYGAVARRDLEAKTAEVYEAIGEDLPLRDAAGEIPAHDAAAVRMLAEVLCRLESVSEFLNRRGWETDDGDPRPAVEVERRLRSEALDWMRELGLTPASRSKLGLDQMRGISMVQAMQKQVST